MSADYVRRFSNQEVLHGIGRNLLIQFLAQFEADLAASPISASQLASPARTFSISAFESLPPDALFTAAACLFAPCSLSSLPSPLLEALSAIDERCAPGVGERHCLALQALGFPIHFPPGSSPEHVAVKLWLANRPVLAHLAHLGFNFGPLALEGPGALSPAGIPEIDNVTLSSVESISEDPLNEISTRTSNDLFKSAAINGTPDPITGTGTLTCAAFRFHFSHSHRTCTVQIRPPHTLTLDQPTDAILIGEWLSKHHYLNHALAA